MISIHPATAFLLYLAITLGAVLILWVRRRRSKILPQEHTLQRCEYCSHGYIAKKETTVSRCPQCQSLNTP